MKNNPEKSSSNRTVYSREKLPEAETWVFDLDNTLYPAKSNIFTQVERNMTKFLEQFLALDHDEAYATQKKYFREYGTTMRGLMQNHGVDPNEYMDFVHDVDLSGIPQNAVLNDLLHKLPGRKVIFTNGSNNHAKRITSHLGIDHHFEGTFDIIDSDFIPKPAPAVYDVLLERYGISPKKSVMVEDMAKNLKPAADLGMTTVWIRTDTSWGQEGSDGDFIDHTTDDLTQWLSEILES